MALYLISTPIGNLEDISARAVRLLRETAVLACEDTRSARRLLAAFQISVEGKQLLSYGEHNEGEMAPRLTGWLQEGRDVALLSESGTPLISDPGFRLVQAAAVAGTTIVPVPGPCAALAALTSSGLPVHAFTFRGFLPKKQGARRRILEGLKEREETLIFYESAQRLPKVLPDMVAVFGEQRAACLARELTKLHETIWRLPLGKLAARVSREALKGQCTLLVSGLTRQELEREKAFSLAPAP